MNKIFIRKTVRGKLPGLPFARIKSAILGDLYELSLVFAGDTLTRRLNRTHRGNDKSANVLSFPLEQNSGEIFLNLQQAKKDAPRFEKLYNAFVGFLFIHACLHLKGMRHGKQMENTEKRWCKKFGL